MHLRRAAPGRTRRRIAAILAFIMWGSLLPATPAAAATPCANVPATPWTDGVYAYFRNTAYCPEWGPYATMSEARLQEKIAGVWFYRGNPTRRFHRGTTVLVSYTGSYNCNGHGTDTYRTQGRLRDTNDETRVNYSGAASLTC